MDPSLPPYFLLSKAKASCSLTPTPLLSQQNLHSDRGFSFDGMPKVRGESQPSLFFVNTFHVTIFIRGVGGRANLTNVMDFTIFLRFPLTQWP